MAARRRGRAVVGETTRPSSPLPSKMTKQKYIVEKSDHKNVITKYIVVLIIQSTVKTVHSTHVQKDLKLSN